MLSMAAFWLVPELLIFFSISALLTKLKGLQGLLQLASPNSPCTALIPPRRVRGSRLPADPPLLPPDCVKTAHSLVKWGRGGCVLLIGVCVSPTLPL